MTATNIILIVEDDVLIAEYLKDILLEYDCYEIRLAHNTEDALKLIKSLKPDVILLDIRLDIGQEGIQIAREINDKFRIPFIFLTAHSDQETIKSAIETNPVTYLSKPFNNADVFAAVNLALKKNATINNSLIIKNNFENIKINFCEILFAESKGNNIVIWTKTKNYVVRKSLDWFCRNSPTNFVQIHRSFIVNVEKLDKFSSKQAHIQDFILPISKGNACKLSLNHLLII